MTIAEHASEAIAVQDACNLSGVVHSFLAAVQAIRAVNSDTLFVNTHPIVTLYLSKLASLNATDCLCEHSMAHFHSAYEECKKLAGVQL